MSSTYPPEADPERLSDDDFVCLFFAVFVCYVLLFFVFCFLLLLLFFN